MIDLYTKAVLTIIAGALVAIVVRGPLGPTSANAFGEGCGDRIDPCHVTLGEKVQIDTGVLGLPVYLTR